jgi:hypothetical protein
MNNVCVIIRLRLVGLSLQLLRKMPTKRFSRRGCLEQFFSYEKRSLSHFRGEQQIVALALASLEESFAKSPPKHTLNGKTHFIISFLAKWALILFLYFLKSTYTWTQVDKSHRINPTQIGFTITEVHWIPYFLLLYYGCDCLCIGSYAG